MGGKAFATIDKAIYSEELSSYARGDLSFEHSEPMSTLKVCLSANLYERVLSDAKAMNNLIDDSITQRLLKQNIVSNKIKASMSGIKVFVKDSPVVVPKSADTSHDLYKYHDVISTDAAATKSEAVNQKEIHFLIALFMEKLAGRSPKALRALVDLLSLLKSAQKGKTKLISAHREVATTSHKILEDHLDLVEEFSKFSIEDLKSFSTSVLCAIKSQELLGLTENSVDIVNIDMDVSSVPVDNMAVSVSSPEAVAAVSAGAGVIGAAEATEADLLSAYIALGTD